MRYYLGLDNGGTSTKAALFDTEGRQIGVEAAATDAITPAPGFVERDMDDMWQDNCRVIRALLEKTGINSRKIAGIGLCGHGKGLYLWGKDEQPVRRGILSADNRAWKYQMDWRTDGTEWPASRWLCWPGCGITSLAFWKISSGSLPARITSASVLPVRPALRSPIIPAAA